jgi:hypothetical protein
MERATDMGIVKEETKLTKIDGVQVYARKNDVGRPTVLDAIDLDESKIEAIADKLALRGYGVMRQRKSRAGKVHYLFQATWAGDGPPPDEPFAGA